MKDWTINPTHFVCLNQLLMNTALHHCIAQISYTLYSKLICINCFLSCSPNEGDKFCPPEKRWLSCLLFCGMALQSQLYILSLQTREVVEILWRIEVASSKSRYPVQIALQHYWIIIPTRTTPKVPVLPIPSPKYYFHSLHLKKA